MKKDELVIYTDGASRGNPGPGGWGAVILVGPSAGGFAMEITGSQNPATNNQMELQAVLAALSDSAPLAYEGQVIVFSDSSYVVNGLNSWVWGWEKKGWITMQKKPVENKEMWVKLLDLLKKYGNKLTVAKVSGHSGDLYNERCDELAVESALGNQQKFFKGKLEDYKKFLEEMGTTKKVSSGKSKAGSKKTRSSAQAYSYVSLVGGKVYTDKTWGACEKRVKGTKGAKYKKVFSKDEERELVQGYTLKALL